MNTNDLLIKGGSIVDPSQGIHDKRDLLIRNGKIEEIGDDINAGKVTVFNASGMLVMPGLIDMHTHLREPGFEEAETVKNNVGIKSICP